MNSFDHEIFDQPRASFFVKKNFLTFQVKKSKIWKARYILASNSILMLMQLFKFCINQKNNNLTVLFFITQGVANRSLASNKQPSAKKICV